MIDRNLQIKEIIEKNPGIQFREIMRTSGLKNGVLSNYLGKLEKSGFIKVMRGPRQTRFYPPKITEEQSIAIKALRKQTPRNLLLALVKQNGLEFNELVKESPSTVSLYLSQIVQDGLVEIRLEKLRKKYYIKSRNIVDKLIEEYRPGLLDKPTTGFEDIFNSF
jgi:predicted transcriptional regulator